MITITALGDSVTDIFLGDTPTIGSSGVANPLDNNAFFGFRYSINGSTNFTPMNVNWLLPPGPPTTFSYNFNTDGVTLAPTDYITVRYSLDVTRFIQNNTPVPVPDPLNYAIDINNYAWVTSTAPGTNDSTTDHVIKQFPISKTGVYTPPDAGPPPEFGYISWTITVGPTTPAATALNGGVITDTLSGTEMSFPPPADIIVNFYNDVGASIGTTTAAALGSAFVITGNTFTFTVPAAPANICRIVITYDTTITNAPELGPGFPPIVYENNVNYNGNGTVGRVPITPGAIPITKTTSGICGNPTSGYWVEYTITADIPAGLAGQPYYLYDTLAIGSRAIPNVPVAPSGSSSVVITATDKATGAPAFPALLNTAPVNDIGTNNNAWRLYLGTTVTPANSGFLSWQYNDATILTVRYRINLSQADVDYLRSNSSYQLTNATYLISSTGGGTPYLSGSNQNNVGGKNINDTWPIFKSGQATDNPALFNYTVTINGAYSGRTDPLLPTGKTPVFTDTFAPQLQYVPGTFYVVDTINPNRFYALPSGTDVTPGTNSFSVALASLVQYSGPPSQGGTVTGPAPDWFAVRRNLQAHFQLTIKPEFLETSQPNLNNRASIAVSPGECTFENNVAVTYNPKQISKTVTPSEPGSDLVHVEIVINPDGGFLFSDGSSTGPTQVTARDELTNLMVYLDGITVYTQTKVGNLWDGNWKPQPISYNNYALWSANVVSTDVIDFVLPNQQPVKIEYDALVTIPQGMPGSIGNKMTIFGVTGEDGENNYQVSNSNAGGGGDALRIRLFKQDPTATNPITGNNIALPGATFTLYVTDLASSAPPYNLTNPIPVEGLNFYPMMRDVVTNNFGLAVFDDSRINASYDFVFLLVETGFPPNYQAGAQNPAPYENYTFFTVNPDIPPSSYSNAQPLLNAGITINQISDFITVNNIPYPRPANSLRLWKLFTGIDINDPTIQQQLQSNNFGISITDPMGVRHNFTLAQAMDPMGIVLTNIQSGTYFIQETGATVDGYNYRTIPQLPIRIPIAPLSTGERLIQLNNIYTIPPIPVPPGIIDRPESLVVWKEITGLTSTQIQQSLQNFRIVITGPNGFNESITLADAIRGVTYQNVAEGTYFFSEVNANVPGFSFTSTPQLPFRRYIMPDATGAVTIRINNTYGPQPPSPQTGVERNIILPIILLSAAAVCIGGAEVYRRWYKKRKTKE